MTIAVWNKAIKSYGVWGGCTDFHSNRWASCRDWRAQRSAIAKKIFKFCKGWRGAGARRKTGESLVPIPIG